MVLRCLSIFTAFLENKNILIFFVALFNNINTILITKKFYKNNIKI